jgi:hypothetical protein
MAFEDLNNVENSLHVPCSDWHDCTWETTSLLSIQLFIIVSVNVLFFSHITIILLGENIVKGARGAKVEVLFQGLHMTHVILVLVYNFIICISNTPFNTALFIYKYILTTNWFYIMDNITRRNLGFFHYDPLQLPIQFDHYLTYYHCAQIVSGMFF